jgi:hypothetical protein
MSNGIFNFNLPNAKNINFLINYLNSPLIKLCYVADKRFILVKR